MTVSDVLQFLQKKRKKIIYSKKNKQHKIKKKKHTRLQILSSGVWLPIDKYLDLILKVYYVMIILCNSSVNWLLFFFFWNIQNWEKKKIKSCVGWKKNLKKIKNKKYKYYQNRQLLDLRMCKVFLFLFLSKEGKKQSWDFWVALSIIPQKFKGWVLKTLAYIKERQNPVFVFSGSAVCSTLQ